MPYSTPSLPDVPAVPVRRRMLRLVPPAAPPGHEQARPSRARRLLPGGDLLVALAVSALLLRDLEQAILFAGLTVPAVGVLEGYTGTPQGAGQRFRSTLRLGVAAVVCGWPVTALAAAGQTPLDAGVMYGLWAAALLGWSTNRTLVHRHEQAHPERLVVLGSGAVAARVVDLVERHACGRLEVVGYLDDERSAAPIAAGHLGAQERLKDLIARRQVDRVLVAFSTTPDTRMLEVLRSCDDFGVRVDIVPRLFELLGADIRAYSLGAMPILTVNERGGRSLQKAAKRAIDVAGAAILLTLTAPLAALVAAAIRLEDRGPVLYRQQRIGYRGKPFWILKFRSMRTDADKLDAATRVQVATGELAIADAVETIKAQSECRVTRVGAFIRRTSLDEIPQLWNVLRGDMSIVGPRPLRAFEVDALCSWEQMRHLERPGITGFWQVTGRSDVDWQERMQMDYTYVRHWSLAHDLEILARTVPAVLKRDGAR